jgi:hypothetical protein
MAQYALAGIRVEDLTGTMDALKHLAPDYEKLARAEFRGVAEHVVGVAQGKMEFGPGTAASSMRPRGVGGAGISFPRGGPGSGKDADGYYPWLDFGGGLPWGRGVRASSPILHKKSEAGFRRPKEGPSGGRAGRYLYPAIGESHEFIGKEAARIMDKVAKRRAFDTEGF